jgi:hypothetical protein
MRTAILHWHPGAQPRIAPDPPPRAGAIAPTLGPGAILGGMSRHFPLFKSSKVFPSATSRFSNAAGCQKNASSSA